MLRTRHLVGAIAAALLFSTAAAATDFSQVVVFGDSLSDAGNVSLSQGSTTPLRFTTNPGKTAEELIAAGLGDPIQASLLGGTDYAFGGAGVVQGVAPVPTLPQQFQMYLAANGGHADANALYQVWGGANDIFYLLGSTTDTNALAAGKILHGHVARIGGEFQRRLERGIARQRNVAGVAQAVAEHDDLAEIRGAGGRAEQQGGGDGAGQVAGTKHADTPRPGWPC